MDGLLLEPWGRPVDVAAGVEVEVLVEGPDDAEEPEVVREHDGLITVHAGSGCQVTVSGDGQVL